MGRYGYTQRRFVISWKIKEAIRDRLDRERGTIYKDPGGRISVALVYPNTYKPAMSNLGLQTLYAIINSMDECVCERAFLPEKVETAEYRSSNTKLLSFESQRPLGDFDIVAFTASFEDDYINIPRILTLADIPVYSKDRDDTHPLVMAGGCGVTLNPEPLAELIDIFFIGEAEGKEFKDVINKYIDLRSKGLGREELINSFVSVAGVYIPSLYDVTFDGAVTVSSEPKPGSGAAKGIKRIRVGDMDGAPIPKTVILTPDTEFSDTTLIEVERGCPRGCRFCTAGFIYLPPRERSLQVVEEAVAAAPGKVGLVGAAVSEYHGLKTILRQGVEEGREITLSSLRADCIDAELLELLKASGYKTITIAPEAGSERLRRVINKDMTDEVILNAVSLVKEAGLNRVKLYFMVGLPSETDADIEAICDLTVKIKETLAGGSITVSVNPFVPKPWTPFQWSSLEDTSVMDGRCRYIEKTLRPIKGVQVNVNPVRGALIQAYLARGDRRLGRVIVEAARSGWRTALGMLKRWQVPSVEESVYRERTEDERFPWEIIDQGLNKGYLFKEFERSLAGKVTPPCDVESCTRCGVC